MDCFCCSEKSFDACCGPVIRGERLAATAEELMRSRYSAYASGEVDWIVESQSADGRQMTDRNATEEWSRRADWQGLEIVEVTQGGEEDQEGIVEFKASYTMAGEDVVHHEIASFGKEEGQWRFVDGLEVKPRPFKRTERKVRPNEPCPCGSGKKHKKCCGKPGGVVA